MDGERYYCSFCGKHTGLVKKLVAGPGHVFICDECILICVDILIERPAANNVFRTPQPSPGVDPLSTGARINTEEGK